jgi:YqaJ-like viral recombinase domain.
MALFDDFEQDLENKIDSEISEVSSLEAQNAEKEDRWKEKRIGKITSSNLNNLMELNKQGRLRLKSGVDYLLEIQHQKETGCDSENVFAQAFKWGKAFEEEALYYYNKVTGNNVISGTYGFDEVLFVDNIVEGFGDSPDGVTGDRKGVVEIKCPYNGANHLRNCALDSYHDGCDYFWQCLGHMIDPQVEWCDFVSYDPRYEDGHPNKIKIIRINRADVLSRIEMLKEKIKFWIECINNRSILEEA